MFPALSDIINYIFGSSLVMPVKTYGFFLALAFFMAGCIVWLELKRKEKEGLLHPRTDHIIINQKYSLLSIISGAVIASLVGYKLVGVFVEFQVFQTDPQAYILSSKGNIWAALIILSISVIHSVYHNRKIGRKEPEQAEIIIHPYQRSWEILIIGIISALIGSKIFDIIDNFSDFLHDPVGSIFAFNGFTFYGGLIITVIVLLWYVWKIKLDWKHVIDATAPAIMLGYAIGRMGCQLSGDGCWGVINEMAKPSWLSFLPDWAWAFSFPHNVIHQGIPIPGCAGSNCTMLPVPVWPTSLYESAISLILFGILWLMRKRMKAPVTLFGLFLILNGIERFFIEKIRVNHRFEFLGMHPTQAEIISFCLVLIGISIIIYYNRKHLSELK